MSPSMKQKVLNGALSVSLLSGIGGAGQPAAEAQSGPSSSHSPTYYVSTAHPDPNFVGNGSDRATGLYWMADPSSGTPRLARLSHTAPMYLGYDSVSGRSYMGLTSALQGNIYSYKKDEGLVHVDSLPCTVVRVEAFARSVSIYGKCTDGAVHGSDATQQAVANPSSHPGTLWNTQGSAPSITRTGSTWMLAYADPKDGKLRTVQASRPHVQGYGIDFTDAEWSKPQYQAPVGMFVAKDLSGYRFLTATPDPAHPGASASVAVYPTLDQPGTDLAGLKKAIESTGAKFIDAGSVLTAQQ